MSNIIRCDGIVLAENIYGEFDKMLTVLTAEHGKISVSAKGAKKTNGRFLAVAQQFCYSSMQLYEGKNGIYTLSDARLINSFYDLRKDLDTVFIAGEIVKLALKVSQPEYGDNDLMRLLLNTLYFLSKGEKNRELLSSIFKIRLVSDQGFFDDTEYLSAGTEASVSHICLSPMEKLFSFEVSENVLEELVRIADYVVSKMLNAI
jgi:DNA repair protein RecO (recombination protein O)